MVLLYHAIKTIENGVSVLFFLKKENLFFFKKNKQKNGYKKQNKTGRLSFVFRKRVFLNPDYLLIFFL